MKKDLLRISDLTKEEILSILNDAREFSNTYKDWQPTPKSVANLFFENSTRTLYSFVKAEQELGYHVTNFAAESSSVNKGESLYDTCKTFEALGFDALVIRHSQEEYFNELKNIKIPIINGGDGTANHPSQCLLDLLTIYQEFSSLENLNVLIVGDTLHSRVAGSNVEALELFNSNVKYSGPLDLCANKDMYIDLDEGVKWADVVMLLRVQHERHATTHNLTKEEYLEQFGLNQRRYDFLKEHAIIMHPAPMNRDVEIEDSVVESPKSRIFKQMSNGVLVRKAILKRSLA